MRDSLTSDNVRDFTARYQNTYGWFLAGENKRILVRVVKVDGGKVKFVDMAGSPYFAAADKGVEFEFLPVTRGVYNTPDDGVLFVSRIPARQWHRGICANNTQFFRIDPKNGLQQIDVEIKCVNAVFNSIVDVHAALASFLKDANNAVALDKHFALSGTRVWFMDQVIGSITKGVITLDNDMFRQELSDSIRRNKYPLSFNV